MTRGKFAAIASAIALVTALGAGDAAAQQTAPGKSVTVPVTGDAGTVATFAGNFTIQKFAQAGDGINAIGTISGVLTFADGSTRNVATKATLPLDLENSGGANTAAVSAVNVAQTACDVLHLELGPIDLDLLGLVVHLDKVVLDIDAQPGPGNLLGNLLCAVVGLFDDPLGKLGQIVSLLNQILQILG